MVNIQAQFNLTPSLLHELYDSDIEEVFLNFTEGENDTWNLASIIFIVSYVELSWWPSVLAGVLLQFTDHIRRHC